jgi:hypothetical protein
MEKVLQESFTTIYLLKHAIFSPHYVCDLVYSELWGERLVWFWYWLIAPIYGLRNTTENCMDQDLKPPPPLQWKAGFIHTQRWCSIILVQDWIPVKHLSVGNKMTQEILSDGVTTFLSYTCSIILTELMDFFFLLPCNVWDKKAISARHRDCTLDQRMTVVH